MEKTQLDNRFAGKVVLVTGAGRGYGRAIADAFARRGAIVAANDITPVNLDVTVEHIREYGGQVKEYLYDVSVAMQVEAMVAEIAADWGRLDILVNNAGVEPHQPILDMDEWDWRRTIDVNLSAPFFLIQAAGRMMQRTEESEKAEGGIMAEGGVLTKGVIINIGGGYDNSIAPESGMLIESLSSEHPELSGRAAFIASKTGLAGLTLAAAQELAADHIHVYLVEPGEVDEIVDKVLWIATESIHRANC